ncbi:arginine metabolism regulation protein II [Exophiala viscosa]|uniref:Arginine metabolism regulation protein II n=1 Tax=Exophiala viscosa TaxID=2486360 RepID=A0AAN6IH21_9EURO|nr:arginine metabolism regulation protein II [Exophiala viscosa]KAI1624020.1 arginine metabolism regulation protein II [Exophiala viscosa]
MPSSKPERQRTRTLTGCQTCRERKLKCDDTRPACRRCLTLGVECQGYGVKLSWLIFEPSRGGIKEANAASKRGNESPRGRPKGSFEPSIAGNRRPLFTDREKADMIYEIQRDFLAGDQDSNIDRAIDNLDALAEDLDGHSRPGRGFGPFGVFGLDIHTQPDVIDDGLFDTPGADVRSSGGEEDHPTPELVRGGMFPLDSGPAVDLDEAALPWLIGVDEITLPWLDEIDNNTAPTLADQFPAPVPAISAQFIPGFFDHRHYALANINHAPAAMLGFISPSYGRQTPPAARGRVEDMFASGIPEQPHWAGHSSMSRIPRSLSNMENISRIPSEARFLLEYYSTDVVDFMCHLPNPQSPWRTIHFPGAMSTMADLLVFGSTNNARMALFYALLSISANHLGSKIPWSAQLERRSQDAARDSGSNDSREMSNYWLTKGASFEDMATAQIQSCLDLSEDHEVYRELLVSLLSMVTISVTSGKLDRAHLYLRRANKLIEMFVARSQGSSFKSSKIAALHQIYSYLQIIYSSTHVSKTLNRSGLEHRDIVWPANEGATSVEVLTATVTGPLSLPTLENNLDSLAQHRDDYQLFAKIYGVPRSLLTLISRASALAQKLEDEEGTPDSSSPSNYNFRNRCELLEDQICNWHPMDDEVSPMPASTTYDPEVGSHLVQAMHDALIVMFFRRVRPVNRMVLQHYVESAADHLNEQEDVKSRTGVKQPALLWPWFMVASEAIREPIRDKLRLWSNVARQYGGRNLEIAEQVVTEVWRRQDLRLPGSAWWDVVRDWDVTLVLT